MPSAGQLSAERKFGGFFCCFFLRWKYGKDAFSAKKNADARGLKSITFRGKGGKVDFTFGFDCGFLLVAAVRNILDAKIAQNLVEVRGVGEHVLYGEGLHGALSVRALAGFFPSAQVKSVIGAALVTQARRVVVMEWGGGAVGAAEVYQKEDRKHNCG